LRAGMPGCFGELAVNTRVHFTTLMRTRGCGCTGHPAFPTPSDVKGENFLQKPGRIAPRGCEGMSEMSDP
jgi:hypothetical protein